MRSDASSRPPPAAGGDCRERDAVRFDLDAFPRLGRLISHPLPAGERDWFTEGLDVILDVSAQPTISEAHQ
ncbi:hypothetical protein ACFSKW_29355 [Nonomuraea mangrovi]|uniref:Uncharacterized protein n=1 Tax=Nonomuraea mangrovi TaxID=2316207 RepID=A0ABW4T2Y7_9ACTN